MGDDKTLYETRKHLHHTC